MTNNEGELAWISLGENCFGQGLINRVGKKTIISPWAWGRSNVEYIIEAEKLNYKRILDTSNLYHEDAYGTKVVRSNLIKNCSNLYEKSVSNNLEFTHHDPISSDKDKDSLQRKFDRFKEINGDYIFIYHHRKNSNSDLKTLRKKLDELIQILKMRGVNLYLVLFHQNIVEHQDCRKYELIEGSSDKWFSEYIIHTKQYWSGNDQEVFWGKCDDDLLFPMIESINNQAAIFFSEQRDILSLKDLPYEERLKEFSLQVEKLAKKYFI